MKKRITHLEPKLDNNRFWNILNGENEELKTALSIKGPSGTFYAPETEDDKRIYKRRNQPVNNQYKTTNNAAEYLTNNKNEEEEIIKNIDKGIMGEFIKNMKKGSMYRGNIVSIDQYGNSIVTFYSGDLYGIVYSYKNQKKPLKIGDKKVFIYEGRNKKGRLQFKLAKHTKKNGQTI